MELVFNPGLSHEETQLRNDWLSVFKCTWHVKSNLKP